jgi:partitioning defective protein 6
MRILRICISNALSLILYWQVTDMMVANSSNLIVTVKPANQRTSMGPRRGSFSRNSNMSHQSLLSTSTRSHTESEDLEDEDEIRDLTTANSLEAGLEKTRVF